MRRAAQPEELGCVIKTLIIQSITNAIIGGRADGKGWDFRSYSNSIRGRRQLSGMGGYSHVSGSMGRPGQEKGARGTIVN